MPSNHLILCPISSPPALNLSQHQGFFQRVASLHQVAKVWSFSFSLSSSNEYSGLIAFRIDLFDNLSVQGTLKSLLHHHSSKASVLWHSAFSMIHLSHPYMTTGKTITLTIWTFVSKVVSLLYNTENSAVATGLEKGQFSFQSQRKAMPKNAQTITQLYSC